jgi:hypothetical protein
MVVGYGLSEATSASSLELSMAWHANLGLYGFIVCPGLFFALDFSLSTFYELL